MKTTTDIHGTEMRVPESYENCLSLWCYHCDYYKNKPERCISKYKRDQEDE